MKHTPGPWKAITATAYGTKGEPSSYIAVMSKDVTIIDWPDLKPSNARLIAAAPLMYDILAEIASGTFKDKDRFYEWAKGRAYVALGAVNTK